MATHRHEITEETAEHPLTRCRDCSGRHLDEFPLIKVSYKTMFEDDYYFEHKGRCPGDRD